MKDSAEFDALLVRYRSDLLNFVNRRASGLLRFESDTDLVQGIHAQALAQRESFDVRTDKEFLSYLFQLANRYIADRHDYWTAAKHGSGRVLRLTFSGSGSGDGPTSRVPLPPTASAGPATFASRREALVLAARALAVMPERDRQLVRWMSEGVSLDEQAERLGLTYAAAQRAGLRAVERFRRTFAAIAT